MPLNKETKKPIWIRSERKNNVKMIFILLLNLIHQKFELSLIKFSLFL